MSKKTRLAVATVNAQADALSALLDGGVLRIYAGVQPLTADTAINPASPANHVLLAELELATPSAPAAVNGTLTFTFPAEVEATGNGSASWYRMLAADGTTSVLDGSVGVTADDPNMVISGVSVTPGTFIRVTALTHTLPLESTGY